jgi:predicted  nucleic acid-binding Zn-ribbon protein
MVTQRIVLSCSGCGVDLDREAAGDLDIVLLSNEPQYCDECED